MKRPINTDPVAAIVPTHTSSVSKNANLMIPKPLPSDIIVLHIFIAAMSLLSWGRTSLKSGFLVRNIQTARSNVCLMFVTTYWRCSHLKGISKLNYQRFPYISISSPGLTYLINGTVDFFSDLR